MCVSLTSAVRFGGRKHREKAGGEVRGEWQPPSLQLLVTPSQPPLISWCWCCCFCRRRLFPPSLHHVAIPPDPQREASPAWGGTSTAEGEGEGGRRGDQRAAAAGDCQGQWQRQSGTWQPQQVLGGVSECYRGYPVQQSPVRACRGRVVKTRGKARTGGSNPVSKTMPSLAPRLRLHLQVP